MKAKPSSFLYIPPSLPPLPAAAHTRVGLRRADQPRFPSAPTSRLALASSAALRPPRRGLAREVTAAATAPHIEA
jgi:hypothetical protein